jgi:ribosomal protein S12 methylthiotransferase accessory factor
MEALEIWHAEHSHPPLVHRRVPAGDLGLPYRIEQLCTEPGALINEHTPLDWINAVGLCDGAAVPVPVRLVTARPSGPQAWLPPGFLWSTNGLASGNSYEEACLHALYEVIERDAVSRQVRGAPVEYVAPASVDDPSCAEVIGRIAAAGATLRITRVPSRFDVPCFGATIWSPDLPLTGIGWGAHLDAGVAVSRAVTEAVQGRLSTIAGSRDDIPALYHKVTINTEEPPPVDGSVIAWDEAKNVGPGSFDDLTDELAWVCAKVTEVVGLQPLAVDLSTAAEFAVVKVFVAGAAFDKDRA